MLLSFQACPDVSGTEHTGEHLSVQFLHDFLPTSLPAALLSVGKIHRVKLFLCHTLRHLDFPALLSLSSPTVEELTCLAAWKDGNARYLVGLVSHNHATSNEERFRCFVYEKTNNNKYGEWACKRGNLLSQSCLIELTLTSSFFHHFQSRISAITVVECRKRKQRRRRWI